MQRLNYVILSLILVLTVIAQAKDVGTIKGTVQESSYGVLLPNITVKIKDTNYQAKTDINGEFIIRNLPVGKYTLITNDPSVSAESIEKIIVKKNKTTQIHLHVSLDHDLPHLLGQVLDKNTKVPIEGASVIASANENKWGLETNKNGQFVFSPFLLVSVANILVKAEGYKIATFERVTIPIGKIKFLKIELEKKPVLVTKTFRLKYKDARYFRDILVNELSDNGKVINITQNAFTITDTKENLEKIGSLVARYDVPLKQIWLEVRLITAAQNKEKKAKLPEELNSLSRQLESLFRFTDYRLLDDARVRVTENEGCRFVTGKGKYNFTVSRVEYNDIDGGFIKLKNFVLQGKGQTILKTSVNIPNGDTLILGASSTDESGKALITAVTAKVM